MEIIKSIKTWKPRPLRKSKSVQSKSGSGSKSSPGGASGGASVDSSDNYRGLSSHTSLESDMSEYSVGVSNVRPGSATSFRSNSTLSSHHQKWPEFGQNSQNHPGAPGALSRPPPHFLQPKSGSLYQGKRLFSILKVVGYFLIHWLSLKARLR